MVHHVTVPTMTTAAKLRQAARTAREATARRDALIVKRHEEQASLRTIGAEAELSHTQIARIVQQQEERP